MINNNKKSGFSLIEVLMSLLILSVVLVVLAPIIVKRISNRFSNGVVYTHTANSTINADNRCYVYDNENNTYVSTRDCSRYEFTVPDGVHKVNLTLVAGGGGGGGAAGALRYNTTYSIDENNEEPISVNNLSLRFFKELKIERLIARGQDGLNSGPDSDSRFCSAGMGGKSSSMIHDYVISREEVLGQSKKNQDDVNRRSETTSLTQSISKENLEMDHSDLDEYMTMNIALNIIKENDKAVGSEITIETFLSYDSDNSFNKIIYSIENSNDEYLTIFGLNNSRYLSGYLKNTTDISRADIMTKLPSGVSVYNALKELDKELLKSILTMKAADRPQWLKDAISRHSSNFFQTTLYDLLVVNNLPDGLKSLNDLKPYKDKLSDNLKNWSLDKLYILPEALSYIPSENYTDSKDAQEAKKYELKNFYGYTLLQGSKGGEVYGKYGRGGYGESRWSCKPLVGTTKCNSDFSPGSKCSEINYADENEKNAVPSREAGGPYASLTYTREIFGFPRGARNEAHDAMVNSLGGGFFDGIDETAFDAAVIGRGGMGGTAVQIRNFTVNPGERYVIYVGKGGRGGNAGETNTLLTSLNRNEDILMGANGESGVTTSIYRVDQDEHGEDVETLVYMVTGGVGGGGGGSEDNSVNLRPAIYSADEIDNNNLRLGGGASLAEGDTREINDWNASNLSYRWLNQEPYRTLANNRGDDNPTSLWGFSNFDDEVRVENYNEIGGAKRQYNGLFQGTLLYTEVARVGGLGGFSGLGTRGGCGAYFMGNTDGRTDASWITSEEIDSSMENLVTFVLNNRKYRTVDYYSGCSVLNSNGQTAEFVLPKPGKSLGAAGAGGGGGGWSLSHGSGNGGNGQDGYVMIEWKK